MGLGHHVLLDLLGTAVGKVQIIGLDYNKPSIARTDHIEGILKRKCPPGDDTALRIVMLHDPGKVFSVD